MPSIALTENQKYHAAYRKTLADINALVALNHIPQQHIADISGKTQCQVSRELTGKSKLSLDVYVAVNFLVGTKNEKKNIE